MDKPKLDDLMEAVRSSVAALADYLQAVRPTGGMVILSRNQRTGEVDSMAYIAYGEQAIMMEPCIDALDERFKKLRSKG